MGPTHGARGDGSPRELWLVVPCRDEARRLDSMAFLEALRRWPWLRLCLVDDGSTDGTLGLLHALAEQAPQGRVRVLSLPDNLGKGEAVRAGLLASLSGASPDIVGFWDADLSTPLDALPLLVDTMLADPQREIVMGSRVKLLGLRVERRRRRHYGGRVVATLISLVLGLPVYDTQCGAKLFRVSPALRAVLVEPFLTRWLFDVELLVRWLQLHPAGAWQTALCELPLPVWRHVEGSKVRPIDALLAPRELLRIRRHYGRVSVISASSAGQANRTGAME
ncbi:MAG: glycosyltransferase [Oligoflexia bacterium]|nr:glycosyltransferase [Oligoflexia bacterium]